MKNLLSKQNLVIAFTLLVTFVLWLFAKYELDGGMSLENTTLYIGQITALFGTVLLSVSYTDKFSPFIKTNKPSQFHEYIGKWAFALILIHPLSLALYLAENWNLILTLFIFPDTTAKAFGIIGLYGYALLLIISSFRLLPHQIWKQTHRLTGIPFFFGAYHGLLAESDIKHYLPLELWMFSIIILGVSAYVYTQLVSNEKHVNKNYFILNKLNPLPYFQRRK